MNEEWFEWDDAKARRNLSKHGVSFEAACRAFEDAFGLDRFDSGPGENRYLITGILMAFC